MNASLVWPDVERRGVVSVTLSRANLLSLLAGDNARSVGGAGIVTVNDDLVVVVEVGE